MMTDGTCLQHFSQKAPGFSHGDEWLLNKNNEDTITRYIEEQKNT